MDTQDEFTLYILSSKRKIWSKFRERLENEGKTVSDVILDLVEGYMGEKE